MPTSLWDMFQPQDAAGQPTDLGGALTGRSNSLIGLGLGLLSPSNPLRGQSSWGQGLEGFQAGAQIDARTAAAAAQLKQHRADQARAQANSDRSFKEGVRQFDVAREPKPSIHWTPDRTDEKGDTIPGKPYLVNPNGSYRELTLEGARNLSSALPQTGTVPGAPPDQQSSADETAIPSTATPVQATPAPALPLNRRKAIDAYSKETGENVAKTEEREKVGSRIFKLIDSLEEKTKDPLFKEAAGPTREYASGQPVWNPARAIYEYNPLGGSEKAKTFLDTIKSDAQAINSELQRAYLQGQGAVTENERAQINQIFGNIAAARSPEAAQAMLKNARALITASFQRGYAVPGATSPNNEQPQPPQTPPAKTGLEGMSKKEIQQELIRRGVLSANST